MNDSPGRGFILQDPIYGFIDLLADENQLVNHPIFRRLRNLRQSPMAHTVYSSANHNRFEHSLGTMWIASQIIKQLEGYGRPTIENEMVTIRLAALLHDIGHGPFSHVFEAFIDETQGVTFETMRREIVTKTEIKDIVERQGCSTHEILDLLERGEESSRVLSSIVSSPLDADRIDYTVRDGFYTGIYGVIDLDGLAKSFRVRRNRLVHGTDTLTALETFALGVYRLHAALYYHRAVRSAELMLSEALRAVDEEIGIGEIVRRPEDYVRLDDSGMLKLILDLEPSNLAARRARELVRSLQRLELLPVAFEANIALSDLEAITALREPRNVENTLRHQISVGADIGEENVFVDILTYDPKQVDILVETRDGLTRTLAEVSQTVRLLLPMNFIRVYTLPQFVKSVKEISKKCWREQKLQS
mgnify:CR=1 FL=1